MAEAVTTYMLPPGPSEPATEQVRRYIETPVEFWEQCYRDYGSATTLELGSLGRVILLSDPEHLRELFRLPTEAFECHQYNEHYRYVMGDLSLLLQDGATHRRQRRMHAPMFRHDALLPKMSVMRDIVLRTVESWPVGTPFNPRPSLHDITFQTMIRLIFGDLDSPTSSALITAYQKSVSAQVGSWGPWRNFSRMQPQIRLLLADEIAARRADPDKPGFMTHIALSTDTDGAPLSDEECEDHVFSLLVAGVDTSAISLAWALHWLSREPAVRERVIAELPQAANDESGRALLSLPYLQAVYAETIRMYPIVPTPSGRKLLRNTVIGPYTYEAGTTLVPCTYLVHRREELYPDSATFRPERFLERKFAPYEYLPYGGGARICVGEMLAKYEFTVAVSAILHRWDIESTDAPAMRPVRHGTLLAPPDSLELVVH
jgi:unspecific monooxygenase